TAAVLAAHRAVAVREPAIGRRNLERDGAAQAGAALRIVHLRETWCGEAAGGGGRNGVFRTAHGPRSSQPKGSANVQKLSAKVLYRRLRAPIRLLRGRKGYQEATYARMDLGNRGCRRAI